MFSTRQIERDLYKVPEIDCDDNSMFPPVDDVEFASMENSFSDKPEKLHIFTHFYKDDAGKPYLVLYVWDSALYPESYKKFMLREGFRLNEKDEKIFLDYLEEIIRNNYVISELEMDYLNKTVFVYFPEWKYHEYDIEKLGMALSHFYFSCHNSGPRGILYRAGLYNIAFNLDAIPGANILGRTPERIMNGMPLELLKILNSEGLISYLFYENNMSECLEIYDAYSEYIADSEVSPAQWDYLDRLHQGGGKFGGREFYKPLYDILKNQYYEEVVDYYGRFIEARDRIPGLCIQLPEPDDVMEEADSIEDLELALRNEEGYRDREISERKKKDTFFEYSNEEFLVTLPESEKDICMEDVMLRAGEQIICSIGPHSCGEETLLFIRKKAAPDMPFAAVEYEKGVIFRIYCGFNEHHPVFSFIARYCEEKGFTNGLLGK